MDIQRVHYTMPPESEITAKVEISHQTVEVKIMGEIALIVGRSGRRVLRV